LAKPLPETPAQRAINGAGFAYFRTRIERG